MSFEPSGAVPTTLKKAVERLETINEALDGANEQRSTANSQRNEQVQNTKTRPSEMGGK